MEEKDNVQNEEVTTTDQSVPTQQNEYQGAKMDVPSAGTSLFEMQSAQDPFAFLKGPQFQVPSFNLSGAPLMEGVNTFVRGNRDTGPYPSQKTGDLGDFYGSLEDSFKSLGAIDSPKGKLNPQSFGLDAEHGNYYRYYNHPKFDELGFHPYKDNETFYNENSSWWDDTLRAVPQFFNLVGTGFANAIPIFGMSSEKAAENMEEAMNIGMSSRGGVGGWMNNFVLNTGYTVGIALEMQLEAIPLALLEIGSAGTATPIVAAELGRVGWGLGKAFQGFKNLHKAVKQLKNLDKAKDVYNAAKFGKTLKKGISFLNPYEQTFKNIYNIKKGVGEISKLEGLARTTKVFGDFYRETRGLELAFGESWMEGYSAKNRYYDELVRDYMATHDGNLPTEEDAQELVKRAEGVRMTASWLNVPTILLTNKLVFDNWFKPKGLNVGARINKLFKEGGNRSFKMTAASDFIAGEVNAFNAQIKKGFLEKGKDFLLKSEFSPISRKYFLGNVGEGIQELSQEAIQEAAIYYADAIHSDPMSSGFYTMAGSISRGLGDQWSAQGFDTFLQGYLTGSLVQGGQHFLSRKTEKLRSKWKGVEDKYEKYQREINEENDNILNAANHIAENALAYSDAGIVKASAIKVATAQAAEADSNGDVKTEKDATHDANINYFHLMAERGTMNLVTEQIDSMLTLSDEELTQAYKQPKGSGSMVRKKLMKLKSEAESYQAKYDSLNESNPNPYMPWMFDKEKQPEKYYTELEGYHAFKGFTEDLLGATSHYENTLERILAIGKDLEGASDKFKGLITKVSGGKKTDNMAAEFLSILIDHNQRKERLTLLESEISLLEGGTKEDRAKAEDLRTFKELIESWNNNVAFHKSAVKDEDANSKTKEGRREIPKRAKYRKGAVIEITRDPKGRFLLKQKDTKRKTKDGKEVVVKKKTYTVEGVTKDGKLIVTVNGKREEVSIGRTKLIKEAEARPSEVEDYGDDVTLSLASMYDTFIEYMRHAAKMSNGVILESQLVDAFKAIKDVFYLEHDTEKLGHSINVLSNPEYFQQYIELRKRINRETEKRKKDNLKKALEKYRRAARLNKFLNDLLDINVFIDEGIRFASKDLSKVKFYDSNTLEEIGITDPRYIEILNLVEDYEEKEGWLVRNKPIVEAIMANPFFGDFFRKKQKEKTNEAGEVVRDSEGNPVIIKDERTLKNLAEQFGFDTKEETEVDLIALLDKIIDSKDYASNTEIALARRLKALIKPGQKVVFSLTSEVDGKYDPATKTITIDPRYSAFDYENGRALETLILREAINQMMVDQLETDSEFKDTIEDLRQKAIEFRNSEKFKEEGLEEIFGQLPLLGLMDNKQFIMAVMTNEPFRAYLSKIETKTKQGEPSNLWSEFIKSVIDFIKKFTKLPYENSILHEAITVIATKLETPTIKEIKKEQEKKEAEVKIQEEGIPFKVSVIKEQYPDLLKQLIDKYRNLVATNKRPLKDKSKVATMTDEEIENFPDFIKALENEKLFSFRSIIRNYKPSEKKETKPERQKQYIEGTKHKMQGEVVIGTEVVELDGQIVEVVEDQGTSPTEEEHNVVFKITDPTSEHDGKIFSLDLKDPANKNVSFSIYTEPKEVEPTDIEGQETDIKAQKADIERRNILLKKANLDKAPEFAKKAITKTVEAIDEDTRLKVIEKAYAGITATPISKELNLTTEQVRSIRTYYGVPDISDKIEYENWKKSIDAELAALQGLDEKAGANEGFSEAEISIKINSDIKVTVAEDVDGGTIKIRVKTKDGKEVGGITLGSEIDGYYGISISVNSDFVGLGISKHLYNLALAELKSRGKKGMYSMDALLKTPDKSLASRKNFEITEVGEDSPIRKDVEERLLNELKGQEGTRIVIITDVSDSFVKEGATKYHDSPKPPITPEDVIDKSEPSKKITKQDKEDIKWINSLTPQEQREMYNKQDERYKNIQRLIDEDLVEVTRTGQVDIYGNPEKIEYKFREEPIIEEEDLNVITDYDGTFDNRPYHIWEQDTDGSSVEYVEVAGYFNVFIKKLEQEFKELKNSGSYTIDNVQIGSENFRDINEYRDFRMAYALIKAEAKKESKPKENVENAFTKIGKTVNLDVETAKRKAETFINSYNAIKTKEDLDNWYNEAVETEDSFSMSDENVANEFQKLYNKELSIETLEQMKVDKEKQLENVISVKDDIVLDDNKVYTVISVQEKDDSKQITMQQYEDGEKVGDEVTMSEQEVIARRVMKKAFEEEPVDPTVEQDLSEVIEQVPQDLESIMDSIIADAPTSNEEDTLNEFIDSIKKCE